MGVWFVLTCRKSESPEVFSFTLAVCCFVYKWVVPLLDHVFAPLLLMIQVCFLQGPTCLKAVQEQEGVNTALFKLLFAAS